MVAIDDWSELITVNYCGGYGGEFFATILHKALNKNINFKSVVEKNNRHVYSCVFDKIIMTPIMLDVIDKNQEKFINQTSSLQLNQYKKIYNIFFSNCDNIPLELTDFFFSNFSNRFDGNKKIALFHNTYKNNSFSLKNIFPKSNNILLKCPYHFYKFTRLMNFLKIYYKIVPQDQISFFERFYSDDEFVYNFYDEFEVDIFELFFNNSNYNKRLSSFLNQEIILDKELINQYKYNNIKLLERYSFNINKDYTKQQLIDFSLRMLRA